MSLEDMIAVVTTETGSRQNSIYPIAGNGWQVKIDAPVGTFYFDGNTIEEAWTKAYERFAP